MDRGERRRRTEVKAARARDTHLAFVHRDGKPDCICELSRFYFAKRKSIGCRCSKKTKGQPKYGHGPCCGFELRPTVAARLQWRQAVAQGFDEG